MQEEEEKLQVYNRNIFEKMKAKENRMKSVYSSIAHQNYETIMDKEQKKSALIQDDREEVKRLALVQDPFLKNSMRYSQDLHRRNQLNDKKIDLYKSTVMSRVDLEHKKFNDILDQKVQEHQDKTSKQFSEYENKRKLDFIEHQNFLKNQIREREDYLSKVHRSLNESNFKTRKRQEQQNKEHEIFERKMRRSNQKQFFDYLHHQIQEKKENKQRLARMNRSEVDLNRKELRVR